MSQPSLIELQVISSDQISPNVQRIRLSGAGLANFPADCAGGYVKLLFNSEGGTDLTSLAQGSRPIRRTYTIRSFEPANNLIEIDFARHITHDLQCGFAGRWALAAKAGDSISVSGPGQASEFNTNADWFFMVADITALPALSVKIQELPATATGYVVIKVIDKADQQAIEVPTNINIIWLNEQDSLELQVRSLPWLNGSVSVWCACEFDAMKALRRYFRNEKQVNREHIYISSYWKLGVAEDGHKVLKKQDAETEG